MAYLYSFDDSVSYALAANDSIHLTLKEEQKLSVQVIYEGNDVFVWLQTGYRKCPCNQVLPFVFDHKLGLIGSERSSAVLVVSPLVSMMVDQVQNLRSRSHICSIDIYL